MADRSVGVIGRAAERAELGAFAEAVAGGPAALSLEGGAGLGKTTLSWSTGDGAEGQVYLSVQGAYGTHY